MRCKVPYDIDIVLEQAQIYPGGIVVIQFPKSALIDKLSDFFNCSCEEEGVVHHYEQPLGQRRFNQLLRLGNRGSEWLFYEDILAVFERGFCQFIMCPDWRNHRHGVDIR